MFGGTLKMTPKNLDMSFPFYDIFIILGNFGICFQCLCITVQQAKNAGILYTLYTL